MLPHQARLNAPTITGQRYGTDRCGCGAPKKAAAKRCRECYAEERRKPRCVKFCADCGILLSKWAERAGTKRCRKCAPRTKERRARSSQVFSEVANRPERLERSRAMARAFNDSGMHKKPKTRAWGEKVRFSRLDWLPPEYWPHYARLRRTTKKTGRIYQSGKCQGMAVRRHLTAAECRAVIEGHLGGPLKKVRMVWFPSRNDHDCELDGQRLKLTPLEVRVLEALLVCDARTFTRDPQLVERIWPDPDLEPDAARNILKVYVLKLRRKGIRILTMRWKGYRIPVEARA
jgi:hypothetical protein